MHDGEQQGRVEEQQEEEVSTKEEELPRDAVPCQVTSSSGVALDPPNWPLLWLGPPINRDTQVDKVRGAAQRAPDLSVKDINSGH